MRGELKAKEHVVAPAARHFAYLVAPDGEWLAAGEGGALAKQGFVDDAALWERDGEGLRHLVTGLRLDGPPAGVTVAHGPEKRPSEYLRALQAEGWVALTSILPPDVLDGFQRLGGVDAYEGPGEERTRHLALDPAMARATCEPLSLWLCRQYMRVEDIKLGHPPSVTALTPDDGERAVQGWHSDFPYMWGSDRSAGAYRVPPGQDELCLALQRNICVSDFRVESGATVFKLASHRAGAVPPAEWGRANQTYQAGDRQAHGLPYGGEETDVIEAPAGTIILYDARTWHR